MDLSTSLLLKARVHPAAFQHRETRGGHCGHPQGSEGGRELSSSIHREGDMMSSHTVGNHFADGDVNATWTTLSHGAKSWWDSARGTVIRIEALVGLVAASMVFLVFAGSWRRRSRNFVAQKVVLVAYISSSSLATYIFGSMQSSPIKSSMFPILAISFYTLSGSADCITAYSLDDNRQIGRQMYQAALGACYVIMIVSSGATAVDEVFTNVFFNMGFFAFIKWMMRQCACRMANESWFLNKMVADYMYQQEEDTGRGSSDYDPATMKGYHYLVDCHPVLGAKIEADTFYAIRTTTEADQVIDIEKVWQCESLSSEEKDVCLSFSLFQLLRRRFFGFPCAEASRQKTLDFVIKGLLKSKEAPGDSDCNRVFKVIQVELAFMYDFFFTNYALFYEMLPSSVIFSYLAITVTASLLVPFTMDCIRSTNAGSSPVGNGPPATATDALATALIVACTVLLQLIQLLHYWTTIWGRVYLACRSVRLRGRPAALDTTRVPYPRIKVLFGIPTCILSRFYQENKCYWQNKLGQYSLLDSVHYNARPSSSPGFLKIIVRVIARLATTIPGCTDPPLRHSIRRRVTKPGKPIDLSAEVKKALVQSIERTQGVLTNGQSALRSNGADHLVWACTHQSMLYPEDNGTSSSQREEKLQVMVILTWHIATGYCEMGANARGEGDSNSHLDIATKLSKYCAYLVVSAPKLLPGHHFDTRLVFEAVADEAIEFLQTEQDKYQAMRSMAESVRDAAPEPKEKIFSKGVRLGYQLEEMEEGARWKVLADFWAEMLLYVAPSDNVKEHIECLAKGGEFITHLWALLTHAGILARGQKDVADDIENNGGNQPASRGSSPEGMVSQHENLEQIEVGAPDACTDSSDIIVRAVPTQ